MKNHFNIMERKVFNSHYKKHTNTLMRVISLCKEVVFGFFAEILKFTLANVWDEK
jgi:hypothetical protein